MGNSLGVVNNVWLDKKLEKSRRKMPRLRGGKKREGHNKMKGEVERIYLGR